MDQRVIKCVKLKYCKLLMHVKLKYRKLLMQSLLANTEASSSGTQLAKSISVLDTVIWIAEMAKQVSLQMV
jgi:hypothetical protein